MRKAKRHNVRVTKNFAKFSNTAAASRGASGRIYTRQPRASQRPRDARLGEQEPQKRLLPAVPTPLHVYVALEPLGSVVQWLSVLQEEDDL